MNRRDRDRRQRRRCRRGRQLRSRYYRTPPRFASPFFARTHNSRRRRRRRRRRVGRNTFLPTPSFHPLFAARRAGRRARDSYRTAPLRVGRRSER